MQKKAQHMTLEVVIVGILLLVVLGVIIYILVYKGVGPFTKGLGACTEKGGDCLEACNEQFPIYGFKGCYKDNKYQENSICCLPEK